MVWEHLGGQYIQIKNQFPSYTQIIGGPTCAGTLKQLIVCLSQLFHMLREHLPDLCHLLSSKPVSALRKRVTHSRKFVVLLSLFVLLIRHGDLWEKIRKKLGYYIAGSQRISIPCPAAGSPKKRPNRRSNQGPGWQCLVLISRRRSVGLTLSSALIHKKGWYTKLARRGT